MSAAILVVHPHREYDYGFLEKRLPDFLNTENLPTFMVPREGIDDVYMQGRYDVVLREPVNRSLQEKGTGALKDSDAAELVQDFDTLFLVGGYLSECLANTYRSIVEAAEKQGKHVEIKFLVDLIYVQKAKTNEITSMQELLAKGNKKVFEKYFARYPDSEYVSHQFVSSTS